MKKFTAVLELHSEYQSGPRLGQKYASKVKVGLIARDQERASAMIWDNFNHRLIAAGKIKCEGESELKIESGFTIVPITRL